MPFFFGAGFLAGALGVFTAVVVVFTAAGFVAAPLTGLAVVVVLLTGVAVAVGAVIDDVLADVVVAGSASTTGVTSVAGFGIGFAGIDAIKASTPSGFPLRNSYAPFNMA